MWKFTGGDGLGESFLPEVTGYQQQISAVDFLADVLKKEKVSIIELAPMTNLARLIQKDKEAFSCVDVYGFFQMFLSRILDQKPEELDILQDLIRGDLK